MQQFPQQSPGVPATPPNTVPPQQPAPSQQLPIVPAQQSVGDSLPKPIRLFAIFCFIFKGIPQVQVSPAQISQAMSTSHPFAPNAVPFMVSSTVGGGKERYPF